MAATLAHAGIIALAFWAPLAAQDSSAGGCVFAGVARDRVAQTGVGNVSIRLFPLSGSLGYAAATGSDGSFCFAGVAAGEYRLSAGRSGYSAPVAALDSAGHALQSLHLAAGKTLTGNTLWLTPDGAISGAVSGPDGEPLPDAAVTLIEQVWRHGKRVYNSLGTENADGSGRYHFTGLVAGRYFVYAGRPREGPLADAIREAPGGPEMRFDGRYFPNAAEVDGAQAIAVHAGEELTSIDCKLALAPVFHVSGSYAGGQTAGVGLKQRYQDQALDWTEERAVSRDGKFEAAGILPGNYFLYSFESAGNDRFESPKVALTVADKDTAGVAAPAVAHFDSHGTVHAEGADAHDALPVQISYEGREADAYTSFRRRAEPQPDGTFVIPGLTGDRYTIHIANLDTGSENGYYLRGVRVNGADVTGREIDLASAADKVELTLSPGSGSVEGTVHSDTGAENLTVLLVPEKVASGDTRPVDTSPDHGAHFRLVDLEPGTYRAFAVASYDRGLWENAEFLRRISPRGTAVEVTPETSAPIEVEAIAAADLQQIEEGIE